MKTTPSPKPKPKTPQVIDYLVKRFRFYHQDSDIGYIYPVAVIPTEDACVSGRGVALDIIWFRYDPAQLLAHQFHGPPPIAYAGNRYFDRRALNDKIRAHPTHADVRPADLPDWMVCKNGPPKFRIPLFAQPNTPPRHQKQTCKFGAGTMTAWIPDEIASMTEAEEISRTGMMLCKYLGELTSSFCDSASLLNDILARTVTAQTTNRSKPA